MRAGVRRWLVAGVALTTLIAIVGAIARWPTRETEVRAATVSTPSSAHASIRPPATTSAPPAAQSPVSQSPSSTAPSSTAPSSTVAGVFVAAGVRQWLHCQGSGPLTVVVVTGLQTPASAWASVRPTLERITRTCVYDRPGLGRSPARHDTTRVVDAELYARELVALLAVAGEGRRVVLVGHSFGGLIARAFVAIDPTRVRGVLLAESVTPHDPTTGAYWAEAGHRVNMVPSSVAASPPKASHEPAFGRLPLLVLSASNPEGDHLGGPTYGQPPSRTELWRTQQRAELALSDNAIQVIARSGHVLQQDNPAAVVDAVRALVAAATTGKFLQCKNIWRDDKATCR